MGLHFPFPTIVKSSEDLLLATEILLPKIKGFVYFIVEILSNNMTTLFYFIFYLKIQTCKRVTAHLAQLDLVEEAEQKY